MKLENKNIKLRKLKPSDASFISSCARDKNITKYTSVLIPPCGLMDARKFINNTVHNINKKISYEFGIELVEEKKIVGLVNFLNINYKNKNANIGIWLDKQYWGRGISKDALGLMLKFGFSNLKLNRIQARVLSGNIRSQKLMEKMRFKLEGRLRRKTFFNNKWFDDLIYGLLKSEFKK